jgi:RNA polymerase sigma factor for flagellar operon FliA
LVKYVAGRLAMNLPSSVDVGDLESFGFFGLSRCAGKVRCGAKHTKFETYATTSEFRGAIIDGLRSLDWVPRSTRAKARLVESQIYELTNDLGPHARRMKRWPPPWGLPWRSTSRMLSELKGCQPVLPR